MWTSRARAVEVGSYRAEAAAAHMGWTKCAVTIFAARIRRGGVRRRGAKEEPAFQAKDTESQCSHQNERSRERWSGNQRGRAFAVHQPLADIRDTFALRAGPNLIFVERAGFPWGTSKLVL